MESLFDAPAAKRRRLSPAVRRLIVDLKTEYPRLNLNELANAVRAAFGREPDVRSVKRVLDEKPVPLKIVPLKIVRNYPPYHASKDPREGRAAVVALRLDGWSVKAIVGYLEVHHSTVYRTLQRWKKKGFEDLVDGFPGRLPGVRKVDLKAIEAVRRVQRNPNLSALSVSTPPGAGGRSSAPEDLRPHPRHQPRPLQPRQAERTVQGTAGDAVRGLPQAPVLDGRRPLRGRPQARRQGLRGLRPGEPQPRAPRERFDPHPGPRLLPQRAVRCRRALRIARGAGDRCGGIFRARQARAVYEALGIRKEEIERGRPWQSYIETAFNVQRRMADRNSAEAESWAELNAVHDRFVEDYNAQAHWAHRERADGRRLPSEVLGFLSGVRHREEELRRAFFTSRLAHPRLPRVRAPPALAPLRGGDPGGQGGRAMARGGEHHPGARGGATLTLRGEARGGDRGAAFGRTAEAVRHVGGRGAATPLRAGRPRRGRLAKGAQAGRVRSPPTPRTAGLAAGAFPLRGRQALPQPFCKLVIHSRASGWVTESALA